LESRKKTPHKKREPKYSPEVVRKVRELREKDPTYSGKKLRPILLRTMSADEVPSVATLGRIISGHNLFFRADAQRRKKKQKAAKAAHERKRKPKDLARTETRRVVEFDMKHIYLLGVKLYAFCAIDIKLKEAVVKIGSSPSSRNAKTALETAVARWGADTVIVNDWGSENMKNAEEYLASLGITQYWAHPHTPKDKPHVERFIGTLQKECLDYNYDPMNVAELSTVVNVWLDKYHHYRPHESLGFLTPAEFSATLGSSIPRLTGVS
jgi:transposase InsO family protein